MSLWTGKAAGEDLQYIRPQNKYQPLCAEAVAALQKVAADENETTFVQNFLFQLENDFTRLFDATLTEALKKFVRANMDFAPALLLLRMMHLENSLSLIDYDLGVDFLQFHAQNLPPESAKRSAEFMVRLESVAVEMNLGASLHLLSLYQLFCCGNNIKGVTFAEKSSDLNYPLGHNSRGLYLYEGKIVPQNVNEAIKYYKLGIQGGSSLSLANYSCCFFHGSGVEVDFNETVRLLRISAERGNAFALNGMGFYSEGGIGVEHSMAAAIQYYTLGSDAGYSLSSLRLAEIYGDGEQGNGYIDRKLAFQYYKRAADIGNPDSYLPLARCFEFGLGTNVNMDEAIRYYRLAALNNDAEALVRLGNFSLKGKEPVISPNPELAVNFFKEAANLGYAESHFNLAECYHHGHGTKQDFALAAEHYQSAIDSDDDDRPFRYVAMAHLGCFYLKGKEPFTKDLAKAIPLLVTASKSGVLFATHHLVKYALKNAGQILPFSVEQAVQKLKTEVPWKNDPMSSYLLARCEWDGVGTRKDIASAKKHFAFAALRHIPKANYYLGMCAEEGILEPIDPTLAFKNYVHSASCGFAPAQFRLGVMLLHGVACEENPVSAIENFERAAAKNYAPAINQLGVCYDDGIGVRRDVMSALIYYQRAAELNDPNAVYNMSVLYERGDGVPFDPKESFRLCEKAAYAGSAPAQHRMGSTFQSGHGVVKANADTAVEWFAKACEQNYGPSHVALGMMKAQNHKYAEAFAFFMKAHQEGCVDGTYQVGLAYMHGKGVDLNQAEAVRYFEMAAKKNYIPAMNMLGNCYLSGVGVVADETKAHELFIKISTFGDRPMPK